MSAGRRFSITEPLPAHHARVEVRVATVEALGPEVVLIASLGSGQEIAARLGRDFRAPVGSDFRLYADLDRVHFFEGETGRDIADP